LAALCPLVACDADTYIRLRSRREWMVRFDIDQSAEVIEQVPSNPTATVIRGWLLDVADNLSAWTTEVPWTSDPEAAAVLWSARIRDVLQFVMRVSKEAVELQIDGEE
jgi:hypothetical protein